MLHLELPSEIRLRRVWQEVSPELISEATRFWIENGALGEPLARERAAELVVVAENTQGALCGVSTAAVRHVPQLGFPCFYYRQFIAPRHRSLHLAREILAESVRAMASDSRITLPDGPKGVWVESQNAKLERIIRDLVWRVREFDFVFFGRSSEGHVMRVCYFPGQRLPQNQVRNTGSAETNGN